MPDVYWMLGISVLGIALNGIGVWKLKSGRSMNKQVMTIHLLEDAMGWVAVLIASIVMIFVNIPVLDPILAIVINLTVLIFVISKLVKSLKIMLQQVPEKINLPELRQKILCLDKVKEVSHLHVWSLTEEKIVVTVHVAVSGVQSLDQAGAVKTQIQDIFGDLNTEHVSIDLKITE